jgi:hypothetical protein
MDRFRQTGKSVRGSKGPSQTRSWAEWAQALPPVSATALEDLEAALKAADFRALDAEMWQ